MDPRRKQLQLETTINWIGLNYEWAESVCIPRCLLYQHYLDFCGENQFLPMGPASFGKVVRQKFSKVTTRRLGTRGQSIYHYCGIGIKLNSVYYKQVYTGKKISRFSAVKIKTEAVSKKYSLSSKTGAILPEFPNISTMCFPNDLNKAEVSSFIIMYRIHSQRILDTVVSANFNEIEHFLFHFWKEIPQKLLTVLKSDILIDFITYCDFVLCKVINDVLVPSSIQEIPESLCAEVKRFIRLFPVWLEQALLPVPGNLKRVKLIVAKKFCKTVLHQLSFLHLAQTVRGFLADPDITKHMYNELQSLDIKGICLQFASVISSDATNCQQLIIQYFGIFLHFLQKQQPLEDYVDWLDELMDTYIIKTGKENVAFKFLLHWNYLSFMIIKDLTLKSAGSFGSIHLFQLMFDEYIKLVIEGLQVKNYEQRLKENLERYVESGTENNKQVNWLRQERSEENSFQEIFV